MALVPVNQGTNVPLATQSADQTDQNGFEWLNQQDGSQWYRVAGTGSEWQKFEHNEWTCRAKNRERSLERFWQHGLLR